MGTPETTSSQGSQGRAGRRPEQARPAAGSRAGARCAARPSRCAKPPAICSGRMSSRRPSAPQRAASRLRRLEQQMQQDSPEARQRAAGELRLEAQQIADEQRRIAAEAARLEKGDGAGRSSAGKQPVGARRDRQLGCVAAARGREGRARASRRRADSRRRRPRSRTAPSGATAIRELEQQKLSSRMREGAARMRDDSSGPAGGNRATAPQASPRAGMAEAEQQIARALDQVVDRMGGAPIGRRRRGPDAGARSNARSARTARCASSRQLRDAEAEAAARHPAAPAATGAEVQRLRRGLRPGTAAGARRGSSVSQRAGAPAAASAGLRPKATSGAPPIRAPKPSSRTSRSGKRSGRSRHRSRPLRAGDRRPGRGASESRRSPERRRQRQACPTPTAQLIARYYESLARKK